VAERVSGLAMVALITKKSGESYQAFLEIAADDVQIRNNGAVNKSAPN
jgi:hypothetical protein